MQQRIGTLRSSLNCISRSSIRFSSFSVKTFNFRDACSPLVAPSVRAEFLAIGCSCLSCCERPDFVWNTFPHSVQVSLDLLEAGQCTLANCRMFGRINFTAFLTHIAHFYIAMALRSVLNLILKMERHKISLVIVFTDLAASPFKWNPPYLIIHFSRL